MPVPFPNPDTQEPRRLLRDVVYDKLFVAIVDGTLELGERLNDDELVRWLGVSRTPVREAIAKLAEQGLVDIEANRYTRVVSPTYPEFVDAILNGYAIWSMFVRLGVPHLDDAARAEVARILEARAGAMDARIREDLPAMTELNEHLLAAAASPTLRRVWSITGPGIALLFQRTATAGVYPWEVGAEFSRSLRDAVLAGDGETAGDLVAAQPEAFAQYLVEVRDATIFPS